MTLGLPLSTIFAFLLVLARTAGLIAFLPFPGFQAAPSLVRAILALALTFALFPVWPLLPNQVPSVAQLALWAFDELGFGLAAGVAVGFLIEAFQLGAQVLSLQAGYGYASTIDPSSQADSGILQVITMLMSGLLFSTLGIDREMIKVLAQSFTVFPAGTWTVHAATIEGVVHLGGEMFSIALRMAMPVIGLLFLVEISLALVGRVQQQLHLISLAFPVKMAAALSLLAALTPALAKLFESNSTRMLGALWAALGR